MDRQTHIGKITDALAWLSRKVEMNAANNLTDINVIVEDFYAPLFNLLLGYDLTNINEINPNAKAIDLGDTTNRIAVQVTSTSNIKKTRTTVEKFIENKLFHDYDRLIIMNLVKVTKHTEEFIGDTDTYQINTKNDIWDNNSLVRMIMHKGINDLKKISDFLQKELNITPEEKLPKETETIIELLNYFSNYEHPEAGNGYIEEPDPDKKINGRFTEHSEFLTNTYISLYEIYGPHLEEVGKLTDIGVLQLKKKAEYLKHYSDKVLIKCDCNPEIALNLLTEEYAKILGKKGIDYDESAIRFFLVNELIQCNVFPNKALIDE